MKLLKSSLLIITMFMIQPVSARIKGAQAPAQAQVVVQKKPLPPIPVAPALPPRDLTSRTSFQYYLQQVRNMKSADVINKQGVFTNKFENFVKSSNLDPMAMEALMQAGRNLHLPLSGNNERDLELTMYAGKRIGGFMESTEPRLELIQPEAPKKLQPSDIEEMLYYDNAMLKQDYLQRRVKELLRTKTANQAITILQQELGQKMRRSWADHGIRSIPTRIKELNQQIRDTVMQFANPNINLIWGEEVKEELPTGNPVWGGQVKGGEVRPPLTKRAKQKLAQKNTPVIQLPAPKLAAEMTEKSVMDYASSLGNDKFADEINSLYKIGATKGRAILDVNNRNFTNVVITLMKDINSEFPKINRPLMYKALQAALFIYYDLNTPMDEYIRAERRIGEILEQNWDEIKK